MSNVLDDVIVIKNFRIFLDYINTNNIILTKDDKISKKDLFDIWNLLEEKQPFININTKSLYYFQIIMYYQIAINMDIIKRNNGNIEINKEIFDRYISLDIIDKYLTLFTSLFVYVDFRNIFDDKIYNVDGNYILIKVIDDILHKIINGKINEKLANINFIYSYAPYILYEFGIIRVELDKEASSIEKYIFNKYDKTEFGVEIAKIINTKRKIEHWNIPLYIKLNNNDRYSNDITKYINPFKKLFDKKDFNVIYKLMAKVKEDKYIMKVKIDNVQRKIKVTADTTLCELHYYLQQIYNFDNKELYAFFIKDKKTNQKESFYPKVCHTKSRTTERTSLGQLGLKSGRGFIYLYDFSVKWIFDIIVEKSINEKVGKKFEVLERSGYIDQYPE